MELTLGFYIQIDIHAESGKNIKRITQKEKP